MSVVVSAVISLVFSALTLVALATSSPSTVACIGADKAASAIEWKATGEGAAHVALAIVGDAGGAAGPLPLDPR